MAKFSMHRAVESNKTSTSVQTPERPKYTATMETPPPSSSNLDIRPPTPVPECPPPPLSNSSAINIADPRITTIKAIHHSDSKQTLSARDPRPQSPRPAPTFDLTNRFPPTPPLPSSWSAVHDHAICVLDTCNYSLPSTIKKLRSAFPELDKSPLTPIMIDKRLRMLDQNPEIDYFRTGLDHAKKDDFDNQNKGKGRMVEAVDEKDGGEGFDMKIPEQARVSVLSAPTSTVDSESDRKERGLSIDSLMSVHTKPFGTGFLSQLTPSVSEQADQKD